MPPRREADDRSATTDGFGMKDLGLLLRKITKKPRIRCRSMAVGFVKTLINYFGREKSIEFRGVCCIRARFCPTRSEVVLNGKTHKRSNYTILASFSRSLTYPMNGKPSPWSTTSRGR